MVPYKLKIVNVQDDIIKTPLSDRTEIALLGKEEENNCSNKSSMVSLYDKDLCETIISGSIDIN